MGSPFQSMTTEERKALAVNVSQVIVSAETGGEELRMIRETFPDLARALAGGDQHVDQFGDPHPFSGA